MNVDNTKEFRCLSLCSGYGGLELGLKRACPNVRTVAYVEVEAFACANLVAKMEQGLLDAAPIWTDIKTFNAELFYNRVYIITAGYPCQPFSVAGKRKGTDDPRHLWPYIERIIKAVRPLWFFGENVSGHLTLGFPTVYRSLRNMGYTVEAGLFSAAECGDPHRRERLFILAKSGRAGTWSISRKVRGGNRPQDVRQENGQACTAGIDATSELADTENTNRRRARSETNTWRGDTEIGRCFDNQWPARPGQPQYEWEEPRVVDDTRIAKRAGLSGNERQKVSETRQTGKGQAQSRLGRAVDGTKCRVERLRLLGNGVVPRQAEKAFRCLMDIFEANR